mgnify:CR=1 FL=1
MIARMIKYRMTRETALCWLIAVVIWLLITVIGPEPTWLLIK